MKNTWNENLIILNLNLNYKHYFKKIIFQMYDKNLEFTLEVGAKHEDKFLIKELDGYAGLRNWNYEDPSKR